MLDYTRTVASDYILHNAKEVAGLHICESVIELCNNKFTSQNKSLCGQSSRWGLWGIIRAEGPDCTVLLSKPSAPAITC